MVNVLASAHEITLLLDDGKPLTDKLTVGDILQRKETEMTYWRMD